MPSERRYLTLGQVGELFGVEPHVVNAMCVGADVAQRYQAGEFWIAVEDIQRIALEVVRDRAQPLPAAVLPADHQSTVAALTALYALKGALGNADAAFSKRLDARIQSLNTVLLIQWGLHG